MEWPSDLAGPDWSRDGRNLLFGILGNPKTGYDIGLLQIDAEGKPAGKPQAWLHASFNERQGVFSRDGRWVAYTSDESEQFEVYVRSFPKGEVLVGPISTAGGIWPRWSPDMNEVYFIAADGTMMAARISITAKGLEAGAPKALFPTRIVGGGTGIDLGRQYDVADDGRFLINSVVEEGSSPIIVIQNWTPASQTYP